MSEHNSEGDNNSENKNLPTTPQEYYEISKEVTGLWENFLKTGEGLDRLVTRMRNVLMESGFSKTQAMYKIAEDHQHLRNFSLPELYKLLPKEEKRPKLLLKNNSISYNKVIEDDSDIETTFNVNDDNTKQIEEKNIVIEALNHPETIILQQEQEQEYTEDFFIPPNRFRKVFMDMMKLRQTGEQTGVYITKDWEVKSA